MMREQGLHPNVRNQLAMVRRDLKTQSKNDVVRAVLGLLVELAKKENDYKIALTKLEKELSVANSFIEKNEEAFQAHVDALQDETQVDIRPAQPIPDEPA